MTSIKNPVEDVGETTLQQPDPLKAAEEVEEITLQQPDPTKAAEEYAYLDRGGFSSEKYKIEVRGLPKFYGIAELKKLMNQKLGLSTSKIKRPRHGSHWLYACFQNDEDRTKAIAALNGYFWKGKNLEAQIAQPAPDPFVKKRKRDENGEAKPKRNKEEEAQSQEEKLKDATTPYWKIPYDQQLKIKEKEMKDLLMKMDNEIWKINRDVRKHIEDNRKKYNGLSFEMMPIQKSPSTEGYRNKCEFTVGMDDETALPTVGFRLGSYATGTVAVAPVAELAHISSQMKRACTLFQEFVRSSGLMPFSPADYSGHWRQLTVRQSFATGELMLIAALHAQQLTAEELEKLLKQDLVRHFSSDEAKECKITSLYYELLQKRRTGDDGTKPVHLMGSTHITDSILGRKFRISPQAFFQTNTAGAEILYQSAIDMSRPKADSTVVDICCGTGTIGLCFAKHCSRVLGVELIEAAVEDARANATLNGITNCDFFAGRAENTLPSVLARTLTDDVIAIVDPPRAGLHMRAVTQLRNARRVRRLVYVSCSPASALKNFLDLARPASKTLRGAPFLPARAVPVDMFPHTRHVELAILFERSEQEAEETVQTKENMEVTTNDQQDLDIKAEASNCEQENGKVKEEMEVTIESPHKDKAGTDASDIKVKTEENVEVKEQMEVTIKSPHKDKAAADSGDITEVEENVEVKEEMEVTIENSHEEKAVTDASDV